MMAETKPATTRIYKVTQSIGDDTAIRLVRAVSPAAAIRHCTEDTMKCEILTADDAVVLGAKGIVVEEPKAPEPEPVDPAAAPGT